VLTHISSSLRSFGDHLVRTRTSLGVRFFRSELSLEIVLELHEVSGEWHPERLQLIELLPDLLIDLAPVFGLVLHASEEDSQLSFLVFECHCRSFHSWSATTGLEGRVARAHLLFVNKLLRHIPRSSAVIRFSNGERIAVTIAPSGIVIAKLWLGILRRRLVEWPRTDPKRLDRALVFFMSGPASDLPGDTVLELMTSRFLRECRSIRDVVRMCERVT
jgi:hypothetical protein